jgi:S1-C subfamily serine protease
LILSGVNVGSPLEGSLVAVGDVLLKVNGNSVSGFSLVQLRFV